jgi:hypothetical protein
MCGCGHHGMKPRRCNDRCRMMRSRCRRSREDRNFECGPRAAVVIEPSLRQQSLQNGNIRGRSRRLLPIGARDYRFGILETKSNARKAGISGPFSRLLRSHAERQNGWLGREDSNLDMTNSKSDPVVCPRGAEEPHFTTIRKPLGTFEFREPYQISESRAPEINGPFGEECADSSDMKSGVQLRKTLLLLGLIAN